MSALIHLDQVFKTYPNAVGSPALTVLRNINLTVTAGESVAITGPSGSGKTTLLHLMATLEQPTSGHITVAGHDLTTLSAAAAAHFRNQEIGLIFQDHHLLPQCNVLENVLLPTLVAPHDTAAAQRRAHDLLDRVGLTDRLHHRPAQLSGGERQRVAVVRALINQPQLLLADEPTGALDYDNAQALGQLLMELNHNLQVTLIVVTHAPTLAATMTRQLQLHDGTIQN